MSKSVVINLGSGNLGDGFPRVTAQLWTAESSLPEQYIGSLPPAPFMTELYRSWQMHYQTLCNRRQLDTRVREQSFTKVWQENTIILGDPEAEASDPEEQDDELIICDEGLTNVSQVSFDELCNQLDANLNGWLKSESFLNIELQMRSQLNLAEEIRVILVTNDEYLRRFPWHCWSFFRDYSKAEVAFAQPEYKRPDNSPETRDNNQNVRILAILGNSIGIDLEEERKYLNNFEDAEVEFLVNPSREDFNIKLWDSIGWDILFFAGHSQTEEGTGRIYLNEDTSSNSLTLDQLAEALKTAIERGLKLAIFNSCDGIGLGLALERLNMPVGIVMREPVPNRVAQEFFKFFLQAFAVNGLSLQLSVQRARRKLQGLEGEFPGASWLPILCINPAVDPPSWLKMRGRLPCPYQGWSAFEPEDASLFFGRDVLLQRLATAVKTKPLVAIIGASGSGKSSLLSAGLIPQLSIESDTWHPTLLSFCPGERPFAAIANALFVALKVAPFETVYELETELLQHPPALCRYIAQLVRQRSGTHAVLIIDQLEELYTLSTEPVYQAFLDAFQEAVHSCSNFTLLFTIRSSFCNSLSVHPLQDAIQNHTYYLESMNREELKSAIEAPATLRQTTLEPGLSDQLIESVWDQPGHLALLEFVLTQLWSKQQAGVLTHTAYVEIGGISTVLVNHAEEVYAQLSQSDGLRARKMFMQLVHPSETNLPKRRIATIQEVHPENWDLVKHLADKRLVVTHYNDTRAIATVELAHDALMGSWPRFMQWIAEDSEFRQWQEQLRITVQQWQDCDRDDEALWRGKLLSESEHWQLHRLDELTLLEREFLERSQTVHRNESPPSKGNVSSQPDSSVRTTLSPYFINHCQQALIEIVGPVAPFLCNQILEQYPQATESEFVDLLCAQLPRPEDESCFRTIIFPS